MTTTYDRPPAIRDGDQTYIRASAADMCGRMLYYSAMGAEKTDELPDHVQDYFDLGHHLEEMVVTKLKSRHHWDTMFKWYGGVITILIGDIWFTGTPDALGRYEPNGWITVVEIKTRSDGQFNNIKAHGTFSVSTGTVYQLAIYRHVLVERGEINAEEDACIATMNRDTGEIYQEWFSPNHLEQVLATLSEEMIEDINRWDDGVPPITLPADSWQCQSCKWRTHCGNVEDENARYGVVEIGDIADAVREWEPIKLLETEHAMPKKLHDDTRGQLKQYMVANRFDKMPVMGNAFWWNASLQQRDTTKLNEEKARYLLGPVQYEQCLETAEGEPFVVIRKGKAV